MNKVSFIPHMLTSNTKLLQKAVLFFDKKVLLLKRSLDSKSRAGKWDLPGGNSEWPQVNKDLENSYKQDIVREIKEETCIDVSQDVFEYDNICYFGTYFQAQKQVYTIIVGWSILLEKKEDVRISNEHIDFRWVSKQELDDYDFGQTGYFVKQMILNAYDKLKI